MISNISPNIFPYRLTHTQTQKQKQKQGRNVKED